MQIVNFAVLREPTNWVIVWTMALLLWFLTEAVTRQLSAATSDNP